MAVHFLEEEAETTEAMVPAMVETDESGQGGAEKIPETDDIFTQLILQANHEAHRVEAVLQVEDKGNNIANLQGFCYAEAERGRDLFWIHGWNKGFNWVEEQIKELHHWKEIKQQKAERRAREKASELPFDEDFEGEE